MEVIKNFSPETYQKVKENVNKMAPVCAASRGDHLSDYFSYIIFNQETPIEMRKMNVEENITQRQYKETKTQIKKINEITETIAVTKGLSSTLLTYIVQA